MRWVALDAGRRLVTEIPHISAIARGIGEFDARSILCIDLLVNESCGGRRYRRRASLRRALCLGRRRSITDSSPAFAKANAILLIGAYNNGIVAGRLLRVHYGAADRSCGIAEIPLVRLVVLCV